MKTDFSYNESNECVSLSDVIILRYGDLIRSRIHRCVYEVRADKISASIVTEQMWYFLKANMETQRKIPQPYFLGIIRTG